MIDLAHRYNRFGSRWRYVLNDRNDLALFANQTFTFIYSNIVLQHMKPEYSTNYIRELLRVLAPAGVLVFQIPTGRQLFGPAAPAGAAPPAARTAASEPLPPRAFNARLQPQVASLRREPGMQVTVPVKVTNASRFPWPALGGPDHGFRVFLANHWRDAGGNLVAWDDGRAGLPHDIPPGAKVDLVLDVTTPAEPGRYVMELDMLQEQVGWFKQKGVCLVTQIQVEVQPAKVAVTPKMEMYGVPKEEVIRLVEQCGGKVRHFREDQSAGATWESFNYFVTK